MLKFASINNILCPVDFSPQSIDVVDNATKVGDVFSHPKINILNVVDDTAPEYAPYRTSEKGLKTLFRTLEQDSKNRMQSLISPKLRGYDNFEYMTIFGKPSTKISQFGKEAKADLIMMATRSMGLTSQFILGSTTYRIIRNTPCPLLVFSKPEQKFRAIRILFPTDFSELSLLSLPYVYAFAKEYDSDIHFVHFRQKFGLPQKDPARELEALKRSASSHGFKRVFIDDDLPGHSPGSAINDYAQQQSIDLTILSSHGVSGYKQFFIGTTAVEVSSRSNCPVLLVRRTDWL
jgi:nucleotide-binding universal stress UspA family protein